MKRTLIYLTFLSVIGQACNNDKSNKLPPDIINISASADSTEAAKGGKPVLTFDELTHNFGPMKEGEQVEYNFKFKNTGDGDLLIVNAVPSCGCTVPDYPKGLIKPGETGIMKIKFDSKGKVGTFDKTISVTSNTEPRETILTISGEVTE